jgi:hypothetical protein
MDKKAPNPRAGWLESPRKGSGKTSGVGQPTKPTVIGKSGVNV